MIGFDRWLLPSTATRQSVRLSATNPDLWVFSQPYYDLVGRRLVYTPTGQLLAGITYRVELADPSQDVNGLGFYAYDRAPLDVGSFPARYVFRTRAAVDHAAEGTKLVTCKNVLELFSGAGCSGAACHITRSSSNCAGQGGASGYDSLLERCVPIPRAGLDLSTAQGLLASIGRTARSADSSEQSGKTLASSERFGLGMPLIDPGRPENSMMMYRLLLGADAYRDASFRFVVEPPDPAELDRASDWFGSIGPMPPEQTGWPTSASPIAVVRALQAWIEQGADGSACQ